MLGIELGSKFARVTFKMGGVPIAVGLGLRGSVSGQWLSAAQRAAVSAADPAANVLVAPLCLLLPFPRGEAAYLALGVLAPGLAGLAISAEAASKRS